MNILVVSGFWPTRLNPITGIFVIQQIQAYLELGCDVTVVAPQIIRGKGRGRPYQLKFGVADVFSPIFFDIPQAVWGGELAVAFNRASCARAIQRTLQQHRDDTHFNAVHLHGIRYGGLSYVRWGSQVKCPAIITLHGMDSFIASHAFMPWFARDVRQLWDRVAHVGLVGRPLIAYADSLGVPPKKRSVVHNGADFPESWSSKQRHLTQRRVVLSVSNLIKWKGIDLNLQALAQIRREAPSLDWEYQIIGDGPERAPLEALAKQLGINDRTAFLGRLAHGETLAATAECDIFSLPSWGEPFGIVYLEAMARGRPVIGCKGLGAGDIFIHGHEGLLVEPGDVQSLKAALHQLLTSPECSSRMGALARATAARFTWRRNALRYLALFGYRQSGDDS